ncbi:MAG: molybdenum cofactor guanylyltransferase [Methanospirillum sp.]|uniref:molybdenum cofactor guanylyltransferase n=1 Tax=Methanospirillum sp. TaxID=45200 RepID=UPI00237156BE|nr:molybdenum cofactor guanylyltransferase [Methanospirillum sp.]MDD1729118.1 molybdenum cofactor guanylyltransferase [Methanospirillum sp.]
MISGKIGRSALILLGGLATRAGGQAKYLFEYQGETFLQRQIRVLSSITDEIIMSCRNEEQAADISTCYSYPCVIDVRKGMGPVEGIHTGALQAQGELILVVACDMPLISSVVIEYIFNQIGDADVAIPGWDDGNLEPLHAVYRRDALLRFFADHTAVKIRDITDELNRKIIPIHEIRALDPDLTTFTNINDLQAFRDLKS